MIEPEECGQKHSKRSCNKRLADADVSRVDNPSLPRRWPEGDASRQCLETVYFFHPANINKASKENESQRRAVIFEEDSDLMSKQAAGSELPGQV